MAQDKLKVVLPCQTFDDKNRRRTLNDLIIKGHIDCVSSLTTKGRRTVGFADCMIELRIPGSPARKLKGLACTTYNILKSV